MNKPPKLTNNNEESMNDFMLFVHNALSMLNSMGNNDYEIPTINAIVENVQSGDMRIQDAKNRINQILDTKQMR